VTTALRDRSSRPFTIGDETITVRVRESSRARTSRIIVGPRRPLEVIVRAGLSDREIDGFLKSKRSWIIERLRASRAIAARPPQLGLDRPGVAWLAGKPVEIECVDGRRSIAELRDGCLLVRGPDAGTVAAVERWYRRAARGRLLAVVEREAARLGLEFSSIGVRDPKTRWGSCSRRGHLSFSWRLLIAPEPVLEYVVVHELLHLREPNHTKAFWRLVEAACPGWQEQARWLREHGQELHDYKVSTHDKQLKAQI
jgi:predicted metal-dependent hydrolase